MLALRNSKLMKQNKLLQTLTCVALFAPLMLPLASCQGGNPRIVQQSGTPSMHEAAVEQTSLSYLAGSPATVAEMQGILGTVPVATHKDKSGEYSHWESFEQDIKGGQYVTNAGCLSKDGKVISSFFQYREPFVKRSKSHTITYGDASLLGHAGMQEAMRKSLSLRGAAPPAAVTPPAAPADPSATPAALAANTSVAPNGQVAPAGQAVPGGQPVGYDAPVQQAPQQPQQNSGAEILRTVNNVMDIVQMFL